MYTSWQTVTLPEGTSTSSILGVDHRKPMPGSKREHREGDREKLRASPTYWSVGSLCHASQELASRIGFLSLKPPPPCAILLVNVGIINWKYHESNILRQVVSNRQSVHLAPPFWNDNPN